MLFRSTTRSSEPEGVATSGTRERPFFSRRARDPHLERFEELYRLHAGDVRTLLYRMGLRGDDAADVHSDVFLVLRDKIRAGVVIVNALGLLHGIAVKLVANKVRALRRARPYAPVLDGDRAETVPSSWRTPEQKVDGAKQARIVHAALDLMPDDQCLLLKAIDLGGVEHGEVAHALDVDAEELRSRLYRARKTLAKLLLQHFGADLGATA